MLERVQSGYDITVEGDGEMEKKGGDIPCR
jgi:hypothetical protein